MTNEEYKQLSIKEFTEAAKRYEGDHAGLYEMCKKDYPDILEELEKEQEPLKKENNGAKADYQTLSADIYKILEYIENPETIHETAE